jgi:peroxiredoxin 2/4
LIKEANIFLGFKLPLISDLSKEISRSFGVLSANGNVALRAQVLIDRTGTIRHHSVNDLGIGRSVDESLRLVQATKWVDENGEVCPVNWKKGKAAINPTNSSEYFNKHHK